MADILKMPRRPVTLNPGRVTPGHSEVIDLAAFRPAPASPAPAFIPTPEQLAAWDLQLHAREVLEHVPLARLPEAVASLSTFIQVRA